MPEDARTSDNLAETLDKLEDTTFNKKTKTSLLKTLYIDLDRGKLVPVDQAERILNICLKEDNAGHAVAFIQSIFKSEQALNTVSKATLINSGIHLVKLIHTSYWVQEKCTHLTTLTLQTLELLPREVLADIFVQNPEDVGVIFKMQGTSLLQMCQLLKILQDPPKDDTDIFIKCNLAIWFENFIPRSVYHLSTNFTKPESNDVMDTLEFLTYNLLKVEYLHTPSWKIILNYICDVNRYPYIIKKLLDERSELWHRLWVVLIKLLSNHITKSVDIYGTPINSLLPVVEAAFKMETKQRCRAFKCWNELIDNFSKETNENCIGKRVRLLIIPLKLNNAKTEEIALAKLDTWWHFVRKFEAVLDKFANEILVPLLHFMFGKHSTAKPSFTAMQLSCVMKKKCLEVLAAIVGHSNCDCVSDLPKLSGKILTIKLLVNVWNDWLHTLKSAIRLASIAYDDTTKSCIRCIWKSTVLLLSQLPGNAVRKDLCNDLINLICSNPSTGQLPLVALPYEAPVAMVLVKTLFLDDDKITDLIRSKNTDYVPLSKLIGVVTSDVMNSYYKGSESSQMEVYHSIVDLMLTDVVINKLGIELFLNKLSSNDSSLKLWTVIMEELCDTDHDISSQTLFELMKWPLKCHINKFTDVKHSAMAWYTIYNLMYHKLKDIDIDQHVSAYLTSANYNNKQVQYFISCVLVAVLKHKLLNKDNPETLMDSLQNLTSNIIDYKEYDEVVPILVDTLVVMLNYVTGSVNVNLATSALQCAKNVIDLIVIGVNSQGDCNQTIDTLITLFRNIVEPMEPLSKMEQYSKITLGIINGFISLKSKIDPSSSLYPHIINTLKILSKGAVDDNTKTSIKNALEPVQKPSEVIDIEPKTKEFTTPKVDKVKKTKKVEPNIVNKVVENGEEYVVVKSNWKFNPRKMTENQKEKFQRKREDIPALYQDLSQSQDEFKLAGWKESQDTSLSSNSKSSKSVSNDNVSALNKLPTDVVPNIMENILPDNVKKDSPQPNKTELNKVKSVESPVTPKSAKSPRLALKDRVFRNMKNLLEKSSPQRDKQSTSIVVQQVENVTTPISKPKVDNINSAPPMLAADRPSRVKRKPKKYDDTEVFELKKTRHSLADSQTASQSDNESQPTTSDQPNKADTVVEPIVVISKIDKEIKTTVPEKDKKLSPVVVNLECFPSMPKCSNVIELQEDCIEPIVAEKEYVDDVMYPENTIGLNIDDPLIKEEIVIDVPLEVTDATPIEPNVIETKDKENENKSADVNNKETEIPVTPVGIAKELNQVKSTTKRCGKKSRTLEKELAIDMVEGHPLFKGQSAKRSTRKKISTETTSRRKCVAEKLNKTKTDGFSTPKSTKKGKEKKASPSVSKSVTVTETQDNDSQKNNIADDLCSDDFIESSQDSSVTTLSVLSVKRTPNIPVVALERLKTSPTATIRISIENKTQDLLQDSDIIEISNKTSNNDSKDDIELPLNKTAEVTVNQTVDTTENMDTLPIGDTDDIIVVNDEEIPITIQSDTIIGPETQELAEADTQPNPVEFVDGETSQVNKTESHIQTIDKTEEIIKEHDLAESSMEVQNVKKNPVNVIQTDEATLSPFKSDDQRKKDFLNNTLEISPIKIQSPDRDKKSPSPETSSDYVVIQLSSPVQSNGEPFDKVGSPEFFTDDKVSPDKRDASPPRTEISDTNTSPSSSLSLKKNRPQVRSTGRAAQMLGLCVPDKLNTMNIDRSESEEIKKSNTSTPARRNLRILYNSVGDNNETAESEESESFLKLKRSLPSVGTSPSGPILKRKLADIADEATASPASKRKRVSFHDPPVSTTISVHKYIEPLGVRSPQNSAQKRLERQTRQSYSKSPKRLDNAFKLVSVLAKAAESFLEGEPSLTAEDTPTSLEVTPAIEIVKNSDLNDTDPICADLLKCTHPIEVIAAELSSPAMMDLLVKELEDKVKTVADLAKMTELEVNRLCIKAPKVQTAKKALTDYAAKLAEIEKIQCENIVSNDVIETVETECKSFSVEMQTDEISYSDIEVQTTYEPGSMNSTQTDIVVTANSFIQTDESGSRSTSDIINTCISERSDFVGKLTEQLDQGSISKMAERLPSATLMELLMNKSDKSNSDLLTRILEDHSSKEPSEQRKQTQMAFVRDFLCQKFDTKELVLFCSHLLQKVSERSS